MAKERFVPIQINPNLCMRCERCLRACKSDAIYFKNTLRYVDYSRCKACHTCVTVCPRNAIVVTSVTDSEQVITLKIDQDKCTMCGECVKDDGTFCPNNLFYVDKIKVNDNEIEAIKFKYGKIAKCQRCLKCESLCPAGAIVPIQYKD